VTWQAAAFAVLGVALLAGFGWYERSRPPAKVVTLVAALAALAIVGRIAFAPLPNIKPTTDIVLLTGFALGGAPGFCVGAITALVSNFFFLQGPWTPWQMVAWGGVGIAGAGLARLSGGRELGRLPLALACAVAGLAFGAFMDLYIWTLGAEQTAGAYAAVSASSLPFNLAHMAGNFVFCLVIGPPLVRALRRYRRRVEVRWRVPAPSRAGAVGLALAALVIAGGAVMATATPAAAGTGQAVRYLERAQNPDGGLGPDASSSSSQLYTGWAALGLAAADVNPRDVVSRGRSTIDYTKRNAESLNRTGDLSRTILLLEAAGVSPRSFAGRDLVAELRSRRARDGSYDDLVNQTSFAILALRAAGAGSPRSAHWLEEQQNRDGGFGFSGGESSGEDTGYVLQALAVSGRGGGDVAREAVRYMKRVQDGSGGFNGVGTPVNAPATAFAVQGLLAVGGAGGAVADGIRYLRSLQAGDGSIRYAAGNGQSPVWVTGEALLAIEREPFPIAAVPREPGGSGSDGASAAAASAPGDAASSGVASTEEVDSSDQEASSGGEGDRDGDRRADRRRAGGPGGSQSLLGQRSGGAGAREDDSEAPSDEGGGSVVGGLVAAASSAAFVVGFRRRLRKRLEGEAAPDPTSAASESP
jgi:energy-coupling factor transport system substrate-specific component